MGISLAMYFDRFRGAAEYLHKTYILTHKSDLDLKQPFEYNHCEKTIY
jgi:hypothetical protein